jgi:hypothetical protein
MNRRNARMLLALVATASVSAVAGDAWVYNIDRASDERARLIQTKTTVAIDPKALSFIASVETRSGGNQVAQHVTVDWDQAFGTAASLRFSAPLSFDAQPNEDNAARAKRFVASHPELFHLSDVMLENFQAAEVRHEAYGDVGRLEQRTTAVPFFGISAITVTFAKNGGIQTVSSHYYPGVLPAQAAPAITVEQAFAAMRQGLPNLWNANASQSPAFAPETRPAAGDDWRHTVTTRTRIEHVGSGLTDTLDAQLVYYLVGSDLHLGWHFFPSADSAPSYSFDVVVDATSGEVLFAHTDILRPSRVADDNSASQRSASRRVSA